ncbi:MAG: hypothetical protein JNK26_00085 [Candidatus Doudnabacteria bacterium]|nr:hypothetical protein [Candidatus Doudnabacteria bacterium]
MDTSLKIKLITQAQEYLVANPQDPMHEITHHYRTVNLAKMILQSGELSVKVDPDLVEVICWWHDVKIPGVDYPKGKKVVDVTAEYLRELVPSDLKDIVYDSIVNHEFGSTPKYTEGMVLQDADKLEILSEPRVDVVMDHVRAGLIDRNRILTTLSGVRNDWLPKMLDRYHFKTSRDYHQKHLPTFLRYLDSAESELRLSEEFKD